MKKYIAVFSCVLLILLCACGTESTKAPESTPTPPVASGSCGDKAKWNYYADGTLYIYGSGSIADCNDIVSWETSDYITPWFDYSGTIEKIILADGITSIGNGTFSGCTNLIGVHIPNTVTSLGNNVFKKCSSLTSVTIPESVESIGNYIFDNYTNLRSVVLPEGIKDIGDCVFRRCESLTSVTIPESVESIGASAFEGCISLENVSISGGLKSIGDYAFYDCPLTEINFSGMRSQWEKIDIGIDAWGDADHVIHFHDGEF